MTKTPGRAFHTSLLGLFLCLQAAWDAPLRAEEPSLELDATGQLVLHTLPPVLDQDEVRPHLTRGLTTTFLFRVDARGLRMKKKAPTGARIEIRYELWDEVFHVAAAAADGAVERRTLDSFGELESWWESLRLVVAGNDLLQRFRVKDRSAARHGLEFPQTARITLDVIPFSQAQQRDTQRWFSETLDDASQSAIEKLADAADTPADTLDRTFHLLMATSIQRQAVVSHQWNVPILHLSAGQ